MIDSRGALYRVTESSRTDGNNPRMMKSVDGGATWSEVDRSHRPAASDLEGCWQLQNGYSIYLSVVNSKTAWFTEFHTSDAPDRPDQWVLSQKVGPTMINGGGVSQFSSLSRTSDGQLWLFHSDEMISGRQQIAFARRTSSGIWGAKVRLGETSGSWTGPRAVTAASDVTHVIYKDHLLHHLLWRKLIAQGELSAAVQLDTAGTSTARLPHTNAVSYAAKSEEVVVVAFADAKYALHAVTITNGIVDTPTIITTMPVLSDPDIAKNDGTVAHLSVDGTTVHALWVDKASGDVYHNFRHHGGAWSAPTVIWNSGKNIVWWVYGNVYTRAGQRRLGFTYDIGEHVDDVGNIQYDELLLDAP